MTPWAAFPLAFADGGFGPCLLFPFLAFSFASTTSVVLLVGDHGDDGIVSSADSHLIQLGSGLDIVSHDVIILRGCIHSHEDLLIVHLAVD